MLAESSDVPAPKFEPHPRCWPVAAACLMLGIFLGGAGVGAVWWVTSGDEAQPLNGPAFTAAGQVTVFGSWVHGQEGEGCVGTDAFADLRGGAPVRVFDLSGRQVAQGTLQDGTAGEVIGDSCTWPLNVTIVPGGALQYQIQVGDHAPLTKTPEELQSGLKLSYGTSDSSH
ncbi:hypothetical protein [Streptomyces lavendulocolor]|uniref:hypothetical protein n=1 Tax=Streptomyces lavendulocolor TaxID=67316 RepID=UPI003C2BC9D6